MARTSHPRTGTFGRSSRRTGTVEFFTRPESNPVLRVLGFIVRMRAELTLIVVLLGTYISLGHLATSWGTPLPVNPVTGQPAGIDPAWDSDATLLIIGGAIAVILIIPASRRYTHRRMWSITTRHRIRAAFSQTRTMTHNGRMPFLLWSRPSPVGERVRVWLPAGMSVKDIQNVTAELATACWARDVRVHPNRAQAALVIIEIVRRDPLATSAVINPSVLDDIDTDLGDFADDGNVVPLPNRNTLPTESPVTASPGPRMRRNTTKNTAATNGATGPAPTASNGSTATAETPEPPSVAGFGGVDVSDYI